MINIWASPQLLGEISIKLLVTCVTKVWKRVQRWKRNLFSIGGREVLVKAVLEAIPSYLISLFKVPKRLCNENKTIMSRFLWGSSNGKKKIAWVR